MKSATKFLVMIVFIGVICTDVGARKLGKVSKELMDQKPMTFPPMPLPTPILPPMPLPVPTPELGETVVKGGGVENGVDLVSKDTKLGISIPKTAATNGIGTELVLIVTSRSTYRRSANDNDSAGPGGPSSGATGSTFVSTNGTVIADGPNPTAYSRSTATRQAGADAAAGPDGATASGSGSGSAYTTAGGSVGNNIP